MEKSRSSSRFIQSSVDVKSWSLELPTVDAVRPSSCPCCASASRPVGRTLVVRGHGRRTRDQWGPAAVGSAAEIIEVICRRYRCVLCGAVLVVAPGGILPARRYSAPAIVLALALWSVARLPPRRVRFWISPWRLVGAAAAPVWASLRRWARAVRAGTLFAGVRALPGDASLRDVAERAATSLAARASTTDESLPLPTRAFAGARK